VDRDPLRVDDRRDGRERTLLQVGLSFAEPRLYASLPWYDLPEMHRDTDALWEALAAAFRRAGCAEVPPALDRTVPHGTDHHGGCFFTQTCGYPLLTTAREHFAVLGAPCYAVPGACGPLHRSFVVVRDDAAARAPEELRGASFAINEIDSNSGMNLPRLLFAPLAREGRFFGSTVVTGSHARSAEAVSAGDADAAAIDCVTFALLRRYRPAAVASLRAIAETAATHAPPLVTSRAAGAETVARLRRGVNAFLADPAFATLRARLAIADVSLCDADAYDPVLAYERDAARLGYPVLA